MKKTLIAMGLMICLASLTACHASGETSAQSRTDLTADHIRGLSADMKRKDVEDLLGQDDDNLASKEDLDVYSLSDGTTAVLRYVDDTLTGVYLRGKDMYEETIFNSFAKDMEQRYENGVGDYNTESGKVTPDTGKESDSRSSNVWDTDSLETSALENIPNETNK